MSEKAVILTEAQLVDACAKWQARLGLMDWRIAVRIARARDFDIEGGACGECKWTLARKEALIRILDPVDYPPDCIYPQDMERTLVHELLHLHFAGVSERTRDAGLDLHLPIEQAFHAIDGAFVALERKEATK